jgi:putative ABC transport system substrate-binding protein
MVTNEFTRQMMMRRQLLIALGAAALAAPLASFAQQQKIYRIGYLANDPDRASPTFQALAGALRELGWIEGKNIEILYRSSSGRDERFPKLAAEIVRDNVDVIVTTGSPSTRAARAATANIPIVFGSAANPVEQKFVASLARPGGNVTGLALLVQELGPKRLQLMKEMLPRATRFARMYQPTSAAPIQPAIINEDNAAARALGVTLQQIPVTHVEGIESAFATAVRAPVDAIEVTAASLFVVNREPVAKLALEHRLPLMGPDGRFAEAGALVSYGENFAARYRRAAFLVDKILRGTKPSDIPVEQPAIFELVVNLKTAKTLGMKIPESILLQADRVIR